MSPTAMGVQTVIATHSLERDRTAVGSLRLLRVNWTEVFAVLVVSHLVGDFLVQTDWQARNKQNGLSGDPVARRGLFAHTFTYTLCFVPALLWIALEADVVMAVVVAVVVAVPHLIQDDGRLLDAYMARVKGLAQTSPGLRVAVDQSFHVLALFG